MRISDWSSDVCSSDLRQNSIVTRLQSAHNRLRVRELYAGEKVQDAFARFDLLERRVDLAEGRADAMSLGTQRRTLEEEIADLESNDKVEEIGRAHVCTPVTNAHLVCRLLLEKKKLQ